MHHASPGAPRSPPAKKARSADNAANGSDTGAVTGSGALQMEDWTLLRQGAVFAHSPCMSPGEDMGERVVTPKHQQSQCVFNAVPTTQATSQPILINEEIPKIVADQRPWLEGSDWDAWARAARGTAATSTYDLPSVEDVDPEDIGFLRSRLALLQTTAGALDSAVVMMFGQRRWSPSPGLMLRRIVNHGLPELEACFASVSHGSSVHRLANKMAG